MLPSKGTELAAGWDCYACLPEEHPVWTVMPGQRVLVPFGFAVELPPDFEMQVRSRSGLAFKDGVHVLNGPGTVDADYRGECAAILHNAGKHVFEVRHMMRVAQVVFQRVPSVQLIEVEELTDTARGGGGYGSTGR